VSTWATPHGYSIDRVVSEVGSGLNGKRRKFLARLADPTVTTIVIEHRDRFARFGSEYVAASLEAANGRRLVVVDDTEVDDDLVRDMTEVLTSFCARLYGRRAAARRAAKALAAAQESTDAA
jgi:predicted site-specific integrase-resolvase